MSKLIFNTPDPAPSGKKGTLKPDKDGCYEIIGGVFNTISLAGVGYRFDGAKRCLANPNSGWNRKFKKSQLHGEMGHPTKFGLKPNQFVDRWKTIVEANAAWLVTGWRLEEGGVSFEGNPLTKLLIKVKPWAPFDTRVIQGFEDPLFNMGGSIRTISNEGQIAGMWVRDVMDLITVDAVGENGLPDCNSHAAPAGESFNDIEVTREFVDAYEHQLKIRSELHGESCMEDFQALDIMRTAAGWEPVTRLDMPAFNWNRN